MNIQPGKSDCPKCHGKGVILPDWNVSPVAIVCSCASGYYEEKKYSIDITEELKFQTMDKFMKYWNNIYINDKNFENATTQLESCLSLIPVTDNDYLKNHWHRITERCLKKNNTWDLYLALEPHGIKNAMLWSQGKINNIVLMLIVGELQMGKTYLLASLLNDRCNSKGVSGKFVRCRQLNHFIKSSIYSGAKANSKYMELIDELLSIPILAMDDIHCIDADERVSKDIVTIISERMCLNLPTFMTCGKKEYKLIHLPDSPLGKSQDYSILNAIRNCNKVILEPWINIENNQNLF